MYAQVIRTYCTGPSAATSSFKVSLTNRCLAIGVRVSLNFSDTTITLKCVSEPVGLQSGKAAGDIVSYDVSGK